MPYKDKEKQKRYNAKYGADWYQRNKELTRERTKENSRRHRRAWSDYKASLSCNICGESHPAIIDFHHPKNNGETKVSYYVRQNQWKKAYEEAAKCDPVCSNCHRKIHWEERK